MRPSADEGDRRAESCHDEAMRTQRFHALVADAPGGRAAIVVPFDPGKLAGREGGGWRRALAKLRLERGELVVDVV